MAEMIVNTPEVKRTVDDYDFVFSSGLVIPITIDAASGDSIQFNESVVKIYVASQPSLNDATRMLPSRDITLFTRHLAAAEHRTREVVELDPEQKHQWLETLKTASKTVQ